MENFAGAQERLGSPYRFGRSRHWVKSKNPAAPAVKRKRPFGHTALTA